MRDAAAAPSDYYETLGVDRDADAQTIKRAFRARARELHPDVSDDPAAARKFSELSEAYAALSKSSTRRLYDEFGYRGRGNGWFDPGGARAAAESLRRRGQSVGEVLVREAEAARGARRTIQWERRERCPACAGEGGAPGAAARACTACAGTGRRRVEAALSDGERLIQIEECAECNGRGRAFGERCGECDGAGERTVRASAEVDVPPGSVDGDRIRLQDGARFVTVRVRALPADQPLVRLVAVFGLLVALAFLALLLR